jgi:hypothetical protein
MSVVPPAAKGTMMRTGLFGQPDCASAGVAASAAKALKPARQRLRLSALSKRRRGADVGVMGFLK